MAGIGVFDFVGAEVRPNPVLPGGTVTVTVAIKESALYVGPAEPDSCVAPGAILGSSALEAEVRVAPEWAPADSKTACIPIAALTDNQKELTFQFTAPTSASTGEYGISIELFTASSGNGPKTLQKSVQVESAAGGGSAGCSTNGDCPQGTVCVAGECVPEDTVGGGTIGGGGGGIIGGGGDVIGQVGTFALLGLGGLIVLKGMDFVDEDADAEEKASLLGEPVPLPRSERPDDDESEG